MMRILITFLMFSSAYCAAQHDLREDSPAKTIEVFFEAFHKQDTLALRNLVKEGTRMQSISLNGEGEASLKNGTFDNFLLSIASIPGSTRFEEKIHSVEVRENGPLANVITPYSFLVNGVLSHCGVNSFELFRDGDTWKIISIIDTRQKVNCPN